MAISSGVPVGSEVPSKPSVILGLVLAFGWLLVLYIPGVSTHKITDIRDDLVSIGLKWLVVLVLGIIAFGIQRRRASEFGVRRLGLLDALAALGAVFVGFVLSGAASRMVTLPSSLTELQKVAALPLSLRMGVVLTAALCEEFMYRGFGIEELAFLTGNRWLAGLLSWVLFSLSHAGLYGFSAALVIPALVGAVLTGLYLWRRNLPSCILMHAIMDGLFLIVIPFLVTAATPHP